MVAWLISVWLLFKLYEFMFCLYDEMPEESDMKKKTDDTEI